MHTDQLEITIPSAVKIVPVDQTRPAPPTSDERYLQTLMQYRKSLGLPAVPMRRQRRDRTHELIRVATQLFHAYPATHFFTLTYMTDISEGHRDAAVREWIDAIEWIRHRPIGTLWANEEAPNFWSGVGGAGIAAHHHGVLFGAWHVSVKTAEELWKQSYGDADVRVYELGRGAIPYVLKKVFSRCPGEWSLLGRFDRIPPDPNS